MDTTALPTTKTKKRRPGQNRLGMGRILLITALVVQAALVMVPLVYMLSTSVKLPNEVFEVPMRWIPRSLHLENYINPLKTHPFLRWFYNSVVVSVSATAIQLITSALAGYSFTKFTYPGRNIMFGLVLATFFIPLEAFIVPLFILVRDFGWLNTYWGLIIPAGGSAFGIFFMRQQMLSLPDELIEAARIDGASEPRIFLSIVLPLSKTALSSLAIFCFMWNWNSFLYPLLVASRDAYRTLPIGLASFESAYSTNYPELMAVSFLALLPILILFLALQRQFIEAIAMTGVKG